VGWVGGGGELSTGGGLKGGRWRWREKFLSSISQGGGREEKWKNQKMTGGSEG